jgi:hypothetical protein
MRKAVAAIVDPWPKTQHEIWDHFGSECAYCGLPLDRKGRKAHMRDLAGRQSLRKFDPVVRHMQWRREARSWLA